jgi:hypothetical protein
MSTAITAVGTSEWLLLITHKPRDAIHCLAIQEPHFMTASQEHAVVCSVLVEPWAPNSGKDPLSYFEWCLVALATSFFRPSSRVGLVWERGARVLHLDPLEIVDGRERRLWLDRATIQFRFYQPSSFNTALQLVLRPHFLVHFV